MSAVELLRCPFCGSPDVSTDCYGCSREDVCDEPAVNCGGCGVIVIFDFESSNPHADIPARWNTRARGETL